MTATDFKTLLPIITKSELSPVEKARATALALNYPCQWNTFQAEVVGVEMELEVILEGTDDWKLTGTIDTLCKRDGKFIMVEHKTRSGEVDKVGDGYYRRLRHDMQITMYHILLECNLYPVDQTIYDVIRKLGTLCKRIPAGKMTDPVPQVGTRAEMCKLGSYHGMAVDGRDMARLAKYIEKSAAEEDVEPLKETASLYGLRMAVAVAEKPEKYYKQYGQIYRSYEQMDSAMRTLKAVCNRIDQTDHEDPTQWAQNTSQCNSYGTACEYMDVCAGYQDIQGDQYVDRQGSGTSGDKNLSHSKLTCYLSCQRKYYHRYILKREHAKEKAPALQFGSVMHEFFAGFWENR